MLVVHALINTKPDSAEIVKPAARAFMTATRTEEGCASYQFYEDFDAPGSYIVVEQWRDQAALDAHGQTVHYKQFLAAVGEQVTGVTVTVHEVSATTVR